MSKEPVSSKIIDRIQALLAMGNDTSSEHEAAIAMRRARKLMDKYQLGSYDLSGGISTDLGSIDYDVGGSRVKPWVGSLAVACAELNDCILTHFRDYSNSGRFIYTFEGFADDVKLAKWMLIYLVDTCNHLYKKNKDVLGLIGLADKNDFIYGVSDGLVDRMDKIKRSREAQAKSDSDKKTDSEDELAENALSYKGSGRELMVLQRELILAKRALVVAEFGEPEYKNVNTRCDVNANAYMDGEWLSRGIHLDSFVTNNPSPEPNSVKDMIANDKGGD